MLPQLPSSAFPGPATPDDAPHVAVSVPFMKISYCVVAVAICSTMTDSVPLVVIAKSHSAGDRSDTFS